MRVKLKYGTKFFSKGTEGEIIPYKDSPKMQKVFPQMEELAASTYVIVRISGVDCLFEKKQLEFITD
jgi:hypothetical protein